MRIDWDTFNKVVLSPPIAISSEKEAMLRSGEVGVLNDSLETIARHMEVVRHYFIQAEARWEKKVKSK